MKLIEFKQGFAQIIFLHKFLFCSNPECIIIIAQEWWMLEGVHKKVETKQELRVDKSVFLIALLTIICFGSFIIGYEMVAVTMLEKQIRDINGISNEKLHYYLTLATTMLPLGAIIGCLIAGRLQALGENKLMFLSDVVVVGSCLLMARSLDVTNLCISRLLVGISCGVSSSVIPPYLVSLSPLEWRGIIGSLHQLLVTIGVGFSFYLGQRLKELTIFNMKSWQLYLLLPLIYACMRIVILFFFKFDNLESYYDGGDTAKLRHFMKLFYNRVDVDQFVAMRRLTKEKSEQSFKKRKLGLQGKLLVVAVILLALNQLSGINIVLSYSKQLLMKVSYYNEDHADLCLQVLAVVQIAATLAGGWLVNKYGCKRMLVAGGQVATAVLFSIFIVYTFSPKSIMLLVALIVVFVLAYAATVGVVPLLYLGQLLPNLSCINIVYWVFSMVGMLSSEIMLTKLGVGKSFFIYGVVCFLCTFILGSQMIQSHRKTRKQLRNEYLYHNKDEGTVLQYSVMTTVDPATMIDENNSLIENEHS